MKRRAFLQSWFALLPLSSFAAKRGHGRIVSVDNGDRGTVFDANGVEVEYCLSANLKTGKCKEIGRDRKGRFILAGDEVKRIVRFRKAPLTFIRSVT